MDAEAAYLLARCRLILDALDRADPGPFLTEIRHVVEATAVRADGRGLRILRRDLLEMSRALSVEDCAVLEAAPRVQAADDPIGRSG
jgi:hypothetical protein